MNPSVRPRALRDALLHDLQTFPVVVVTGARQTGKSTLVESIFPGRPYLTLDDLDVLEQAASAPRDLLERYGTVTLDEVQRQPDLLLAVKALVDRDRPRRPGRFLLTGSANLLLMKAVSDSLAGRAVYRNLLPMTRGEQAGLGRTGAWSALLAEDVARWPDIIAAAGGQPEPWTEAARRGGFPVPALELRSDADRSAWLEAYLRTYLERDLRALANVHQLPAFRRLMRATALRIGGLLNAAELGRDLGIPASTVQRHLALLETSHLVVRLEPYAVNRTKRMIKAPKVYFGDTGLALHLAGGEPGGQHLENLVLTDLMAWAEAQRAPRPGLMHWRTASGQEVDLVVEDRERLLAIEVKATRTPGASDVRHLRAFREDYGDRVAGCLLLHTGEATFRMQEGIVAAPWWRVL